MAIGLAEALGQKGEVKLPTRSVAPTKSDIGSLLSKKQKQQQGLQEERQKLAAKLLSFNDPVLPGDREKRKEMFSKLVTEMNQRAALDPNWRPSDDEFSTKMSEVLVENKKMEDMYKQLQKDIQFAARNKEKIVADEGDIDFLDLTQDPLNNEIPYDEKKFQEARSKYAQGSKWWDKNYMETNPWTKAIGPGKSFNVKNEDITYTQGKYNYKFEGYNPDKDPKGVEFKKQLDDWIEAKSPDSKSLYQQAKAELVSANRLFDRKDEAAIKQKAFEIVYPYYKKEFPLTTSKTKTGSYNINVTTGGGGNTITAASGNYNFGSREKVEEFGNKDLNVIVFQPKAQNIKPATLKDLTGKTLNDASITNVYYDDKGNIVGGTAKITIDGIDITKYWKYEGANQGQLEAILTDLDEAYQKYSNTNKRLTKGKNIKQSENTGKGKTGDTRSFVPDFLNDAIKNIGDFLRPRAPEPPQPGGPDVTGMV